MTKQEKLLALMAESLILIFAQQTAIAGKFKESEPIIESLKNRFLEVLAKDSDL